MFVFENCNFTCITDIWYGSYACKIDVFVWGLQFCQVKHWKTDKNESRGLPGRSQRLKKKQKNDQTPPGELGFGGVTPFLSKKSVQRVKLASPEDPKIDENEVEKAVFLSHGPCNLFPNDFGWFGETRTLEFHAPMQVKHNLFKKRLFELRGRFCIFLNHFFDKKGVTAPDPSSPGGVWSIFCFFFNLFDRPWGPFSSFLYVYLVFTWQNCNSQKNTSILPA